MPRLKSSDLQQMYQRAESAQSDLFAEQRSNILLFSGMHYAKKGSAYWRRIRNATHLSKDQKVRLTKNHIQKIIKSYLNYMLSMAPGQKIAPKNPSEYSDQAVAVMHESVWQDMVERQNLKSHFRKLYKDFCTVGEAWNKVFFDPEKGEFLGYETEEDEDGKVKKKKDGQPLVIRRFTGDVVFERILGFNVLTDPNAQSWEDCRWVCIRKMVDTNDLKKQFEGDEDKLKSISSSTKNTYMLFDGVTGSYRDSRDQTMVREWYFKPNLEYPNGYYYIDTESGILFEGELPYGIFPIDYVGFDEAETSARSFSIIKTLRPYQAEINRAASKIVEHQLTVGDDKVITQGGVSLSPGAIAHGVKQVKASGPVTVLPGRAGDQFVPYMESQIREMYLAANLEEESLESAPPGALDPYSFLFRSLKNRKKFTYYADKLNEFNRSITFKALKYAKKGYTDDMIINVIDKKEIVNIPEFKSSDDLSWQIVVMDADQDVESLMGKQIALNHLLQYGGGNLDPQDLGLIYRNMPFANSEEILSDKTVNYDNFRADVLALDRGEMVNANPTDDHDYMIRMFTHRMKRKDFQFLPPQVQQNYQLRMQQHEFFKQEQVQQAALATSGFIPSGGFMVTCDIRVPDPTRPGMTRRAQVPVEALSWLLDKLQSQGLSQDLLATLPPSSQANIGRNIAAAEPDMGVPDQGVINA